MRKVNVFEQHKSPQSHIVKTEDGSQLWRNCSHLLLKRKSYSNGNLDDKINDYDQNESDRDDTSKQKLGNNSCITRNGRVIKKPFRFRDT